MSNMILTRAYIGEDGAFGMLSEVGKAPFCLTLEHTYDDLAVKIPVGTYLCKRSFFNRGGYDTFEIIVPGHTRLLFHKGNMEDDSDGCVLLGMQFGKLGGKSGILTSAVAFQFFMIRQNSVETFTLEVK